MPIFKEVFILKRLLPILTLLFIFMLTPFASATTPLGLTQSEVDILSGYGREGIWETKPNSLLTIGSLQEVH